MKARQTIEMAHHQNDEQGVYMTQRKKTVVLFKCYICLSSFTDTKDLYRHMSVPHTFSCEFCQLQFSREEALTKHTKRHLNKRQHQCEICKKKFWNEHNLSAHVTKHGGKVFKCDLCQKHFSSLVSMKEHMTVHSDTFRCDSEEQFNSINDLDNHVQMHTVEESYKEKQHNNNLNKKETTMTKEKSFECEVCVKKFQTESILNEHMRIHSEESLNSFETSLQQFEGEEIIINNSQVDLFEIIKCEICFEQFVTSSDYRTHMEIHTTSKSIHNCIICFESYENETDLKVHSKTHYKEDLWEVDVSSQQRKTSSKKRSLKKGTQCKVCNKEFFSSNMKDHMRTHTGEKPFTCHLCQKPFNKQTNLRRHLTLHTGEKPYKCDICQKLFGYMSHLRNHILTVHCHQLVTSPDFSPHMKIHNCKICFESFENETELIEHIKNHSIEELCNFSISLKQQKTTSRKVRSSKKDYQCSICFKIFTRLNNLNRHLRIHTGDKPFNCHICPKQFNIESNLKKHLKTQSCQKPYYKCEICLKSFGFKKNLKDHILTVHSNNQLYSCEICSMTFKLSTHLKFHMKTHTETKPHKCKICQKSFTKRSVLKEHVRTHTGKRPFKCDVCLKRFSSLGTLQTHVMAHQEKLYNTSAKSVFSDFVRKEV